MPASAPNPRGGAYDCRRRLPAYHDVLRITDPADVYAYHTSSPPGDEAAPHQQAALREVIDEAFAAGGGLLNVTKSVGVFLCRKVG